MEQPRQLSLKGNVAPWALGTCHGICRKQANTNNRSYAASSSNEKSFAENLQHLLNKFNLRNGWGNTSFEDFASADDLDEFLDHRHISDVFQLPFQELHSAIKAERKKQLHNLHDATFRDLLKEAKPHGLGSAWDEIPIANFASLNERKLKGLLEHITDEAVRSKFRELHSQLQIDVFSTTFEKPDDKAAAAVREYRERAQRLGTQHGTETLKKLILTNTTTKDRSFIYLDASSGCGKTQMAFNLTVPSSTPPLPLVYLVWRATEGMQDIYRAFRPLSSSFFLCVEKDWDIIGSPSDPNTAVILSMPHIKFR
eukprot:Colp12_sorted_trinity150504_noHs@18198